MTETLTVDKRWLYYVLQDHAAYSQVSLEHGLGVEVADRISTFREQWPDLDSWLASRELPHD